MKICISNLGMDKEKPEDHGPCLEGNLRLVNDNELFEQQSENFTGPMTLLNFILLDPISAADIARMAKNEDHLIYAKISNNIFSENVFPRNAVLKMRKLTQMELLVLALMAENYTRRKIAEILNIDEETTKSHGHSINKKTGLRSKLQVTQAFIAYKVLFPQWRLELKESLRVFCPK